MGMSIYNPNVVGNTTNEQATIIQTEEEILKAVSTTVLVTTSNNE